MHEFIMNAWVVNEFFMKLLQYIEIIKSKFKSFIDNFPTFLIDIIVGLKIFLKFLILLKIHGFDIKVEFKYEFLTKLRNCILHKALEG